jgi:serine/threonine protein kinase
VKSIPFTEWVAKPQLENEIEKLINLRHPCIAAPIGFVLPSESEVMREWIIVELHLNCGFLSDLISMTSKSWTATAKAKAVESLVLGLRFVPSLGFIHGDLHLSNVHFDVDHHIPVADCRLIDLEVRENKMGGFSSSGWTAQTDVHGLALIPFEIVIGRSAKGERSLHPNILKFVSNIITTGLWSEAKIQDSFCHISLIS